MTTTQLYAFILIFITVLCIIVEIDPMLGATYNFRDNTSVCSSLSGDTSEILIVTIEHSCAYNRTCDGGDHGYHYSKDGFKGITCDHYIQPKHLSDDMMELVPYG